MIETETTWNDSGFDCDHCGGHILERTDIESGQPARVCYQCQACGCQWQLGGEILRVGNMNSCVRAQRNRDKDRHQSEINPKTLRLIVVAVVLLLFGIVFFRGLLAIRFLIPVLIAYFVFITVYRLGKEKMWW